MTDRMSLREFLYRYDLGDFDSKDVSVQCEAGWYDWFCQDKALAERLKKMVSKLKAILKQDNGHHIDQDKHYVWFKNNAPFIGSLYDDFRIATIDTNEILFTVIPSSGHDSTKGQSELWGHNKNGSFEMLVAGKWRDVVEFFRDKRYDIEISDVTEIIPESTDIEL